MARAKFVVVNTSASAVTHHCYLKVLGAVLMIMLVFSGIAVSAEENCTTEDAGKCDVVHRKNNGSHNNTDITSTMAPNPPKIAPQSMDMLSEDQMDQMAQTVQIHNASTTEEPTGRALNFTTDAHVNGNVLQTNGSKARNLNDLSDVTIDENDDSDESEMQSAKILTPKDASLDSRTSVCEKGGLTYEEGEKLEVGCDSVCTCRKGKMECADRCPLPFFRKGKKIDDPLCAAKEADDPCCSIMVCAADTETEPLEMCSYKNKTYNRGEIFDKGCEEVCSCEIAGNISCKPRCLPVNKTSDRCVEVQDPKDPCCKTILCDVTLDDQNDHDDNKDTNKDETRKSKLLAAKFVNSSTVELTFDVIPEDDFIFVEASEDKNRWETYKIDADKYVTIKPSSKYLRMENSDEVIKIEGNSTSQSEVAIDGTCSYKGSSFKLGDEFNDNCTSLCVCKESGMKCLNLDCPTYFGVDVLDPNCVEWETVPPHFVPSPPNCCPQEIVCKNNGSCVHEGQMYQNWQQLPPNITGCDKRCYCEMGKVECQNSCPPVTALPPPDLECLPHQAKIGYLPDDDCCKYWVCNEDRNQQGGPMFPGNYPNHPGFQPPQDEISVHTLEAVDAHTVRLAFMVPPVIVGLHGRVEVRYTHDDDDNFNNWELQVFAPPNDLIGTPQLEFDLLDLKADTEYRIKITITLRDLHNTPSSRVYKIKTPRDPNATTLPPMIPIKPELVIADINATWVTVTWRKFTEYELQFIDGVQLRYKELEGKIYDATPLIHRSVTSYTLENLKPNTKYEIGIFFIPFPGQMTELHSTHMLHFTTANEMNTYGFNVTLDVGHVKSTSVEITWSGVPYPEDKYVNIYRAIYQSDTGKEDQSTFKIAKRDSPTKTIIMDLKPGTRYRLWLEVYLTNGKIKTSNVQDFITKPRPAVALGATSQQASETREAPKSDYYGPLVIVAILAAIAILSTLILLLILLRRHNQNKAAITPPSRISQSAYDNPTYKVEIQQETMGL